MNRAKTAEDEYFRRQEANTRRYQQWEEDRSKAAAKEHVPETTLHSRRCPQCRIALQHILLREIDVERCSRCGGVWLSSDEVDVLLRPGMSIVQRVVRALRSA